jgi:CRP-like cAMP-binding protein
MKKTTLQLSHIQVFDKLPEAEIDDLLRLARRRFLRPGDFLCHQGDIWPNVVFLASGELRWVMLAASGREHVLFTVQPDHAFWGHSLFDGQPMPASLVAAKKTEAYWWSREIIFPVLMRHPQVMWEVTRMHVGMMRRAREIIYGLAFQPVAARLASLLLDSFYEQEGATMERDLTLSEIATMVASSPEVICRVLHNFQAEGILDVTRAHITLHDRDALSRLVDVV